MRFTFEHGSVYVNDAYPAMPISDIICTNDAMQCHLNAVYYMSDDLSQADIVIQMGVHQKDTKQHATGMICGRVRLKY